VAEEAALGVEEEFPAVPEDEETAATEPEKDAAALDDAMLLEVHEAQPPERPALEDTCPLEVPDMDGAPLADEDDAALEEGAPVDEEDVVPVG